MNSIQLKILVVLLFAVGLGIFSYKAFILGFPLTAEEQTEIWNVEAHVSFEAVNKPVKATLQTLNRLPNYTVTDEYYIGDDYGLLHALQSANGNMLQKKNAENIVAIWSRRSAKNKQDLFYSARLRPKHTNKEESWVHPTEIPKLTDPHFTEAEQVAANSLITEVGSESADIETFVPQLMKRLMHPNANPDAAYLLRDNKKTLGAVNMAVRLLHFSGIPAQSVHGITLTTSTNSKIKHWLELYHNEKWHMFDVTKGSFGTPVNFVTWWRGNGSLATVSGGKNLSVTLSVVPATVSALGNVVDRLTITAPAILDFSLFTLPVQAQATYRVILLIPIGVLLLVFLRNVIGVTTFGTFMPVLIALSFRETQLLWGLCLFSIVIILGLAVRLYLEHLKLLLVPRLACVLIVVVLLMAGISIVSFKLGFPRGVSVSLFPMVILSMTIERISVMWDELGAGKAIQQCIGSMAVAVLAYIAMSNLFIEHLIFVFPELFLVLLGLTLMIGRYTGYRLLDLIRFRTFLKES
ncbi:inactive transglutaminase family protein [Maridesulfovibrio sp.]|uniref:inactive transglutaminase family protein n=1 Tax=Maridesulfovibrio sp. TaxID=2795000 RepID=UPI0029CA624C|nr:inactive transglutaminase family protein [Maridesulfovibrio sp.]